MMDVRIVIMVIKSRCNKKKKKLNHDLKNLDKYIYINAQYSHLEIKKYIY